MLQVVKPLNSFNGVGFNSKASMSLPVGPTYNEIHLVTSLKAAQIRQVSVVLNGDTIIQVSGDDLVMMEDYKGHFVDEGTFVIPFTNPTAKNQNGANFGGLVTLAGENITLEVEIGAGSGALTLDAYAFQTPAQARRVWVPRIRTHVMPANAAGWNDFTTFPANAATSIRRAYFKAGINRLKVERDNLILFDAKDSLQRFQQKRIGRFPQEGVFTFDPTMYGFEQADVLNTGYSSEFVFRVEVNEAKPIPVLVESIQQVAPLSATA
ncbi:major capsid protein P2 [Rhodanobacter aciditrophus]|uniref:Major capsid protein P2 n=1 Tax=Rhodanobacter aciditrophus TaxID=1623218 RepID=A0ABW4B5K2_9GAMM